MVESLEVKKYEDLFDDEKAEDKFIQIINEQNQLISDMYDLEHDIIKEESKETAYKSDLWLNTNFKEKKLTNKELREAYVDKEMKNYISSVADKKNRLTKMKRQHGLNETCLSALMLYLGKCI